MQGLEVVRLLFRPRTGSAGLQEDKEIKCLYGSFICDIGNFRGISGYWQMR